MLKKLCKEEKGSAITEFALTLPLVLLLVFGYIFFMNGVKIHIIMQTAAREGARAYANPMWEGDNSADAIGTAEKELAANNIKGATVSAYANGYDRIVVIEKPYATRFPLKNFTLRAYSIFHCEPVDREE